MSLFDRVLEISRQLLITQTMNHCNWFMISYISIIESQVLMSYFVAFRYHTVWFAKLGLYIYIYYIYIIYIYISVSAVICGTYIIVISTNHSIKTIYCSKFMNAYLKNAACILQAVVKGGPYGIPCAHAVIMSVWCGLWQPHSWCSVMGRQYAVCCTNSCKPIKWIHMPLSTCISVEDCQFWLYSNNVKRGIVYKKYIGINWYKKECSSR